MNVCLNLFVFNFECKYLDYMEEYVFVVWYIKAYNLVFNQSTFKLSRASTNVAIFFFLIEGK